jgi:hypothetical protein
VSQGNQLISQLAKNRRNRKSSFCSDFTNHFSRYIQDVDLAVTQIMGTGGGFGNPSMSNDAMAKKIAAVSAFDIVLRPPKWNDGMMGTFRCQNFARLLSRRKIMSIDRRFHFEDVDIAI